VGVVGPAILTVNLLHHTFAVLRAVAEPPEAPVRPAARHVRLHVRGPFPVPGGRLPVRPRGTALKGLLAKERAARPGASRARWREGRRGECGAEHITTAGGGQYARSAPG
jgi:hypothetical protein